MQNDMTIHTPLTTLLGINTPLVSAAMVYAAGGELAAQVSLSGGFGFIGVRSIETLSLELSIARSQFPESNVLPIGVGILAWILESVPADEAEEMVQRSARECKAVWFSFGAQIGKWIEIAKKARADVLIFVQINSVEEAITAVEEWKVDVLIAQDIEAGGHGSGSAPPLLNLIPSILSSLTQERCPLLAAGGLVGGAHLASLLALGADGIVLGTRFSLASESLLSPGAKCALIAADHGSTLTTLKFDIARGTMGWPEGIDGRGLKNKMIDEWDDVGEEEVKRRLEKGNREDDSAWKVIWAGTGVGNMDRILPAADIVKEVHDEAMNRLRAIQQIRLWS